jgi:hypothetical protein
MRFCSRLLPWASSGAGCSTRAESGIEILKRLLEANLGRVERAHGSGQPVFGEIVGLDFARARDQLHRAHRRLVVAVGEHVDVSVGHAFAIEPPRGIRETSIAQATLCHQYPKGISERLVAQSLHN